MNFYEEQIDYLKSKINSLPPKDVKIKYLLNDYTEDVNKDYYFSFYSLGGNVKIRIIPNEKIINYSLKYYDASIESDSFFETKKGVYEIKLSLNLLENVPVEIEIEGAVKYANASCGKVVNFENCSYILSLTEKVLSLFKYDGQITLIEKIEGVTRADICKDGDILQVAYLLDGVIYLKSFSEGNAYVESFNIPFVSDVKCTKGENIRLYVVKNGYLSYINVDTATIYNLNLQAVELYAVEDKSCIYKDNFNLVRLCNDCTFPKILKSMESIV